MVREIVPADWPVLRDIRLEALRTAPSAFGSSYAGEVTRDEAFWRGRSSGGNMFFAYLPSHPEPAGLAGGYQPDPVTAELVSMYVRPRARGHGVGEALVAAVTGWARARRAASVHLWVTETNAPARTLYERCGFTLTGEAQPLPSDPSLAEVGMTRPLESYLPSTATMKPSGSSRLTVSELTISRRNSVLGCRGVRQYGLMTTSTRPRPEPFTSQWPCSPCTPMVPPTERAEWDVDRTEARGISSRKPGTSTRSAVESTTTPARPGPPPRRVSAHRDTGPIPL